MVKVLLPPKPEMPMAEPGMRISVMPSPHILTLDDYEYYDALGRDPLQQNNIWSISDPTERVQQLKKMLPEYPKQMHRRQMLFKAASRGDEAIVRFLVETGLKVHPDVGDGQNEEGDGENGKDEGSIPDKDDPSVAPLHVAALKGKLGCVKILLGNMDVDVRDEFGRTPLIAAARGCDTDTIRYLLGQGADPTARSDAESELTREYMGQYAGADALEIAAAQRNVEAVKLLLEHPFYGATRKRRYRKDGEAGVWVTPLAIESAAGGDFETLKLLLERGAYPMEDKDGKKKGELLTEEEKQAIIDATQTAAERGDLESLKLLLSYQYATDKDGKLLPFEVPERFHKPFIYGAYHAMKCNKPEKFEFLNNFGLKEHDTMSLDKLPEGQLLNIQHLLDEAAANGSVNSARLMIEKYGANPNQHRIPSGVQPLYAAASNNKPEMVRYLLEDHKADVHLGSGRFATGPTALWIAIHLKSLDCVAILLRHGGPVDHVDEKISNVTKPMTAILICSGEERNPIRLETKENAREYTEDLRTDFQNLNPSYIRIEIGPDDRDWIRNLQQRRTDEQLREEGEGGRELNENEKVKKQDLDVTDPRRNLTAYPTNLERENELDDDDDLMPQWKPFLVPATQDDDD
ncbi:hypothetical protein MMC17_001340 [Xylographa soralifera]|nr:hypothetical protein [Xylographa soralifera]